MTASSCQAADSNTRVGTTMNLKSPRFATLASYLLFSATVTLWALSLGKMSAIRWNSELNTIQVTSADGVLSIAAGDAMAMKFVREKPSAEWGSGPGWHSFTQNLSERDSQPQARASFQLSLQEMMRVVSIPYWLPALIFFLRPLAPLASPPIKRLRNAYIESARTSAQRDAVASPRVIYVPLLAAFPVLALYAQNVDIVDIRSLPLPLLAVTCAATVLWYLLGAIIRNHFKSALVLAVLLGATFAYGFVHDYTLDRALDSEVWLDNYEKLVDEHHGAIHGTLLSRYVALIIIATVIVTLWPGRLSGVTRFCNYSAIALTAILIVRIGWNHLGLASNAVIDKSRLESTYANTHSARPDIYYIILDAYARQDVLAEHFSLDNSAFIEFLETKGFFVGHRSRPNYIQTHLSLASSLNLRYLDFPIDETADRSLPYRMIQDNDAVRYLRQLGYRFVHFNSSWEATSRNPFADIEMDSETLIFRNDFYRALALMTPMSAWSDRIIVDLRKYHLDTLAKLRAAPVIPGPKFVFAHLLLPHPPYVFGRDGGSVDRRMRDIEMGRMTDNHRRSGGDLYVEQLLFVNSQIETIVEAILSKSKQPPVIVIQSDHGPEPDMGANEGDVGLKGRSAILNAIYLPVDEHQLHEAISPVNLFRVIFNACFGANFDLLEDKCDLQWK
jgi:hypothetical protein